MRIGLVVAIEMDPIFAYYKDIEEIKDVPNGFKLYKSQKENSEIYILQTGMGEIAASAGVQYLISVCKVDVIVNYGVVGGLTTDMSKHKVCVLNRVVHYKYDCSGFMDLKVGQVDGYDSVFIPTDKNLYEHAVKINPDLMLATCCSGDKFVDSAEEKNELHEQFEGDVCDMESAGVVLTCKINNVPCLLLKAVSDGLVGGANEFYDELQEASAKCLSIADEIISTL